MTAIKNANNADMRTQTHLVVRQGANGGLLEAGPRLEGVIYDRGE